LTLMNDGLTLKLCRTSNIPEDDEEWIRLKNKANSLELDKKVDEVEIEEFWRKRMLERNHESHAQVSMWKRWESNSCFVLSIKEDKQRNGDRHLILPDIFLQLMEGHRLRGFFPCSDGKHEYTVEHLLNSLKENEDWENWEDKPSELSYKDPSRIHGAIKSEVNSRSEKHLGEEWQYSDDEYTVGSRESGGKIDLVFKHESETRYNLVEVKPSKDTEKIDRVFGQLFRYKHAFVDDKVSVGLDDVEITIAAPDFHYSHEEAADELGINLVPTDYGDD